MKNHTFEVDRAASPAAIRLAPVFNISVPFMDRHLAEGRGDKLVARGAAWELTYAQLFDGACRTGALLRACGVEPGDRVVLLARDTPAFYFAFLGAARIGAVTIPVNTFLRASDYAYMLRDSGAQVVFAADDPMAELERALAEPGLAVRHRISIESPREGWRFLDDIHGATEPDCPVEPTAPDTPCFWLYSSGSTGSPKASIHEHKDMIYTSEHFGVGITGMSETDVIFSAPKLFFAYGVGNSFSFPLYVGATAVLLEEKPTAENTIAAINRFQPTIYYGVPTLYAAQLAALDRGANLDPGPLRFCHSGGEALPAAIFERWKARTGLEIYDGIGSSEVLHIYTSNRPGDVVSGSSGRAVPGYELKVMTPDGREAAEGEPGELWIRGDSVAKRYWNKPEKNASSWQDGWFRSGDTVYRDADGRVYFCGRDDDMLKVGGIWVSPFEIESALAHHPAILEAAVVGASDESGLVKPRAHCVLREDREPLPALADELIDYVKTRLAPFKYPRWIVFERELPKTATGKVQRFKLR